LDLSASTENQDENRFACFVIAFRSSFRQYWFGKATPGWRTLATMPAFGDETHEWHQLRIAYNVDTKMAQGFVDGRQLGETHIDFGLEPISLDLSICVAGKGVPFEVYVDDFDSNVVLTVDSDNSPDPPEHQTESRRQP